MLAASQGSYLCTDGLFFICFFIVIDPNRFSHNSTYAHYNSPCSLSDNLFSKSTQKFLSLSPSLCSCIKSSLFWRCRVRTDSGEQSRISAIPSHKIWWHHQDDIQSTAVSLGCTHAQISFCGKYLLHNACIYHSSLIKQEPLELTWVDNWRDWRGWGIDNSNLEILNPEQWFDSSSNEQKLLPFDSCLENYVKWTHFLVVRIFFFWNVHCHSHLQSQCGSNELTV